MADLDNQLSLLLAKLEVLDNRVRLVEERVNILDTITIDHESRLEDLEEEEDED